MRPGRLGSRAERGADLGEGARVEPQVDHGHGQGLGPLHTAEFAGWAGSESGDKAVLEGAKALAMTVVDLWLDPGALAEVRATFGSGP